MYSHKGYHPRRRRECRIAEANITVRPAPFVEDEPLDMTRLSLKRRLAILERLVAMHPGRAITEALLDLFPELHEIP